MKTLIAVGAFLLFAQYSSADFIVNCTNSGEDIEEMEYYLNLKRKLFANNYQVMNMHKLKYDSSLAKHAVRYKSCDDLKQEAGDNYRIDGYSNEEAFIEVTQFVERSSGKEPPRFIEEHLNPQQTSFARCRISQLCYQKMFVLDNGEKEVMIGERNTITFYGPNKQFLFFSSGPPGYMCRYGHQDGLCLEKGAQPK